MREDTATLVEIMLSAEQFCAKVELASKKLVPKTDESELRLKVGFCRNLLAELQVAFEADELTIDNPSVRAQFGHLVIALLWVAFRGRQIVDFKLFRKLVMIETTFSQLLILRG